MHPATLRAVITKLYFAIFAAFKEYITLNLAQRLFKVVDFGTNRNRVYIYSYWWSIATWTISRRTVGGLNVENRHFPYPLLYSG